MYGKPCEVNVSLNYDRPQTERMAASITVMPQ